MIEILLPSTDAGVALQFGLVFTVTAAGLWFTRHNKDVRRLVFGLGLMLAGLMAVRAIH
ncbi:MAG: hypothetical protein BMS9Abin12_0816 [Acidimicrobiia bacterium]|nr:MAG: hypothetical protein BMS9Abin12_0816 [Acidimicrobiia bacterium]